MGIYNFIRLRKIYAMGKYGFSFSLNRLLGITSAKQRIARQTGIPTTQSGLERKVGRSIINLLLGAFLKKK